MAESISRNKKDIFMAIKASIEQKDILILCSFIFMKQKFTEIQKIENKYGIFYKL